MTKNIFRRILSIASALAIVFTAYPPVIFADDGGLCPHHPEHTAECGYVEGASPCNFVCEICNPPEISDLPEPSDTPAPEVTTSPEEQPPVTTAPEPEPVETGTTETMPEESETVPTEPLQEPDSSPAEPEIQLMSVNGDHNCNGISDWQAWEIDNSLPTSAGNWYLTKPVTLDNNWNITAGEIKLCLNGQTVNCGEDYTVSVSSGASLTVYDCSQGEDGIIKGENFYFISVEGSFTLESGNIVHDGTYSVAITATNADVTINGGTVEALGAGFGMGITAVNSTVTVTDGVIKGGSSSEQDYGINYVGGTLNISGEPTIKGGTADIYLAEGDKITINDPLSGGPYSVKHGTGTFATGTCAAQSVNCFTSADPTKYMVKVTAEGNGLEIVERPKHIHEDQTEFQPWVSGDSLPTTEGNYYLTTNVTLEDTWSVKNGVKLCLNGYDIICGGHQIQVGSSSIFGSSSGSLSVYDCAGGGEISGESSTVYVDSGNFTLYGGKISSYGELGSALYMNDSVTIYGGEIISQNYNGITLMDKGKLTVSGGNISGKQYAIDSSSNTYGSFTLSGSPKLDGQTADIYTDYRSSMTIKDLSTAEVYTVWYRSSSGTFATVESGNADDYVNNFTSAQDGYDVVTEGDQLKLVEKHIHDGVTFERWYDAAHLPNAAGNYCLTVETTLGGGWTAPQGVTNLCVNGNALKFVNNNASYITVPTGATFNIYDCQNGEIGLNSDNYDQSALTVTGGTVTIYSGNIIGLHAPAIKCETGGTVNIEGGKVSGQNENGIGVLLSGGTLNMTGGVLECVDGSRNGYGDALKIESGTANLLGGSIESNKNGIEMTDDGTIMMDKFIMTSGSYGMYIKNGTVEIRNSTITSTNDRGTIYYRSGGNVTVEIYDSAITGTDDVIYALSGGSLLSIEGGTVTATDPSGTAIYAGDDGCSNVYITDCKITGCRGMMLNSPRRKNGTAIIEDCIIQADRDFGINTQFGNTEIIDCNITSDNDSGIYISYGGSVTFSGKNVITAKKYGIQLSGGNISFDEPPTIDSEEADICFESSRMTISEPLLLSEPYTVLQGL